MDKLGIFKLLTSLFDFYQKKNSENSPDDTDVNDLFKFVGDKDESKPSPANSSQIGDRPKEQFSREKRENPAPLQSQMLNAISEHEAFVKRVKNRTK
jgi:hypothetical protein